MILSFDILCVLLGATLIARVLIYFWTHHRYYYLGHLIPGPCGLENPMHLLYIFGPVEGITKIFIKYYEKSRENIIVKFWLGLDLIVVVFDPDTVKNIFQEHLQKADFYKFLEPWTGGKSLLDQNDIPAWKRRRHTILSKSFSFACLEYYNKIFHDESKILADKMELQAKSETTFEPFHLTEKAGFGTILRTMCGLNLQIQQNGAHQHAYTKASETELQMFSLQVLKPWYRSKLFFYLTGFKAQESQACKTIHNFVEDLFNKIKANLKLEKSSQLVLQKDESYQKTANNLESFAESVLRSHEDPSVSNDNLISHKDLLHEMSVLLNVGYDTSKLTNAFVLILLAMYPKIQQDVYDELINVLGEDPRTTPTNSQLNELQLLDRVIKETLRLFPPAPIVARVADREIQAGEYTIPKGSTMVVLIYGIHRDPRHWPNPTRFDPDRFLPSEVSKRSPNAFMPFSLGPRNCIGYKYAMLSIKITISTILRRYRILPGDKCKRLEDIRFKFGLTLVPLPGNDIRIEKRNL